VSDVEIDVLTHLKSLPKGTVLALPSVTIIGTENSIPKSLYSRYDTAYVAAFSGQQTYLNDLVQLRLTGIEYQDRLDAVTTNNCIVLDQVSYIYVAGNKSQIEPWEKCMRKMDLIKINQEAALYKLQ
jgi:hypothetical protein